jgi:hypothetical protein
MDERITTRAKQLLENRGWMDWSVLDMGLDMGLVSFEDVIASAEEALRQPDIHNEELVTKLAGANASEHREIRELLQQLSEAEDDQNARERWRLAVLEAINELDLTDEQKLEQTWLAYAEFDYPEDMRDTSPYTNSDIPPLEALERVISHMSDRLEAR